MADNLNAINSNEQNEHKWWLLERIRNSGKKVLAPVLAAGSISLWWLPAATIPATWAAVATVLTACSDDEPDNPNDTIAPTVNVSQHDVDITWWKQVRISWNQLYIWDVLVASWTDNVTKNCTVELSLNWKTISSWTIINEWWYLTVKVRDEAGNTKTIDIKLTMNNQLISWLENLQNLSMQVDQEVNLLNWITFWNGASLVKVEIEMDWQTTQITDPNHYTPQYPWQCKIIFTVQKDWKQNEVSSDMLTIKPLEYANFSLDKADLITWLRSDEVFWDLSTEWERHLIETTKTLPTQSLIVEMLENWTTTMTPTEIKNLLAKNEIIMMWEWIYQSPWFQWLYEFMLDSNTESSAWWHWDKVWKYLMTSVKKILQKQNKKFKIYHKSHTKDYKTILEYIQSHPQSNFYLFTSSPAASPTLQSTNGEDWRNVDYKETRQAIQNLSKANNVFCIMWAITNIKKSPLDEDNWALIYKIIKTWETDTPNSQYTIASDWWDAAMWWDNNLTSHSFTTTNWWYNDRSMHPSITLNNDGRIRSGTSHLYSWWWEGSSRWAPKEAWDLYDASCINMIANPNITSSQNRKLIRDHGLTNQVLVDGQPYCTTISVNPWWLIYQLYPQLPNTINLGSENLIKIPKWIYKNSVIVWPWIVDQNGTQITKSNYKNYIWQDLYFSPKLIKKYWKKAWENTEYTIYLCTDAKWTWAWNNTNQANKAIDSQTVSITFSN